MASFFCKNLFFFIFFLHIVKSRLHPANCNLKQELKMDKKEWLLNQYRNEPQADEEVLRFIANFVFHENGKTGKGMESVKNLFSEDYCWHFAHMLKTVFGRGQIYCTVNEHHFVWRDTKTAGIMLYDINGIYHTHKILVPEEELEEGLQEIKKGPESSEEEPDTNIVQRMLKQAVKINN